MATTNYDVIVIGVGSMGSATCYQLAKRGYKVLGIEQFDTIPHDLGSHGGQSRIIRKAYFEHPDYVPLLNRAYQNWKQLETTTGEQIYFKTGLIYLGPPAHEVIKGIKKAAALHQIEVSEKTSFNHFISGPDNEMLWEPDAGFLLPEKAISLFVREAIKKDAVIKTGEKVIEWKKENGSIKVITDKENYNCRKLVITAGPWAGKMISDISTLLKVTRQVIIWVQPEKPTDFLPDNFPCWVIANENIKGVYYGFPYLDGKKFPGPAGLKFALHHPDKQTEPDEVNREITKEEILSVTDDLKKNLPVAASKVVAAKTCLYTNSPDENFIIDHLPGYDKDITVACGFSGHGFKFVSAVGEALADLAMDGKTSLPVGFLGLKRFE
jgi:sarcosine oxidase